jgi:hypothetical protein
MPNFLAYVPLIILRELNFMDYGAAAHFSLFARRHVNRKFPVRWVDKLPGLHTHLI